jgi:ribosome-associated toxin RatA of RatAB toxin-antitoxin module
MLVAVAMPVASVAYAQTADTQALAANDSPARAPAVNSATATRDRTLDQPAPAEPAAGAEPTSPPVPVATSQPAAPAPITAQQVTVPGANVQAARVRTEVRAPYAVVASVVTDYAHYRDFFPQLRESRIIHRRRGQADVYLRVEMLGGLGMLWSLSRFTAQRTPESTVVEGTLTEGNLRRFDVRFEVRPVNGDPSRTDVTMQLLGVPAFFFPDSILASQQLRWAARGLEQLRARAESFAQPVSASR